MTRKKKRRKPKPRSAVALTMAKRRKNAGPHKDRKKAANKAECRQKLEEE